MGNHESTTNCSLSYLEETLHREAISSLSKPFAGTFLYRPNTTRKNKKKNEAEISISITDHY